MKKDYSFLSTLTVFIVLNGYQKEGTGGVSRSANEIIKELNRRGVQAYILSPPPISTKIDIFLWSIPLLRKIIHYFFVFLFIIAASLRIFFFKLILKKKVIIQSTNSNFCLLISSLSRIIGCKAIHTFRSFDVATPPNFLTSKINTFTCVGYNLPQFFRDMRYTRLNIKFIPNGVDVNRFFPVSKKKKSNLRNELKWPNNKFILLYAARLNPHKKTEGLFLVLDAISSLKDSLIHFVIIGDGRIKKELITYAKNKRLANKVSFLSLTENLSPLFQASDVYMESPNSPNQSIASLEAMACGKPVINCVDSSGYEALKHNYNGLICQRNSNDIANAILYLYHHPKITERFSKNAVETIREDYTWERIVQKYLEIYKKLLFTEKKWSQK